MHAVSSAGRGRDMAKQSHLRIRPVSTGISWRISRLPTKMSSRLKGLKAAYSWLQPVVTALGVPAEQPGNSCQ